jgi:hypothetical protein
MDGAAIPLQRVCPSEARLNAPYAADTRAKGWRFEIDHERIRQSDTWALARAEIRPWLLMLWLVAWEQAPCGSLPADEALIAARIEMPAKTFAKHKAVLLRGWKQAEDGRLYHPVITERVLEMVSYREKAATRKAAYRDSHKSPNDVPRDSPGDSHVKNDTGTGTGTGTKEEKRTEAIASAAAAARIDDQEAIFALGVPLLLSAGVPEKNARSFFGRLRKFNTDPAIVLAIDRCAKVNALQPIEFLQGCLKTTKHFNAQEALEASNRAVGDEWLKEMQGAH